METDKLVGENRLPGVCEDKKNSAVRMQSALVFPESVISENSYTPGIPKPTSPLKSNSANEVTINNDDVNSVQLTNDSNNRILDSLNHSLSESSDDDDDSSTSSRSSNHPSVIKITMKEILNYKSSVSSTPRISQKSQKQEIEGAQKVRNENADDNSTSCNISSNINPKIKNGIQRRGSQQVITTSSKNLDADNGLRRGNCMKPDPQRALGPQSNLTLTSVPAITPENFPHSVQSTRFQGSIHSSSEKERLWKESISEKQKKLKMLVKTVWPQIRLPPAKHIAATLSPAALEGRPMFSPLTVGIVTMRNKQQMVSSVTVTKTKHSVDSDYHRPVMITEVCDPREYLIKHCPTYQNPPLDEDGKWTDSFVLNKVLPELASEVNIVQRQPGLLLTVKEIRMRGLEEYRLFECVRCANNAIEKTFGYAEVIKHLLRNHYLKEVIDEEHIKINIKEYVFAFSKNLPPRIVNLCT
ncbi:571_t:CDS:1 [Acaulospora morrowiae]|uniref:571_t:CDS:1 n=1 Tax=Acaulospora morrowiae TaxID=94023 RepID=A0A9N8VBI4_9GLOM|nr:571_t:CDS:1 [Acaulospora morrowiae]